MNKLCLKALFRIMPILICTICAMPKDVNAQVFFNDTIGFQPVCTDNGLVFTSGNDDCSDGQGRFDIDNITVGPPGTQTVLSGVDGSLTVGGNFIGNTGGTFNAGVTVNNGNVNINGGDLFVNNVRATGFGTFQNGLNVTGGTINFTGLVVQNVGDPVAETDAANKRYVDGQVGAQNTVIAGQQTQINAVVTVNQQQQTQINSQGGRIGSLEVENAQQSAAISDLFVRDADQQRQIGNLQDRDEELSEGIAIALSLDTPTFLPGQEFAMRAGWGNFDGSDAFGVTAGGVIDRGSFGPNSSVILDGGVGFGLNTNTVAGKAGLSFGW